MHNCKKFHTICSWDALGLATYTCTYIYITSTRIKEHYFNSTNGKVQMGWPNPMCFRVRPNMEKNHGSGLGQAI